MDMIEVSIEDVRNMATPNGFVTFCIEKRIDLQHYNRDQIVSISRSEWRRYGSAGIQSDQLTICHA